MKEKGSRTIIFTLSIITLLALSSVSSFGISTNSVNSNDEVNDVNVASSSAGCLRMPTSSTSRLNILVENSGIQSLDEPFTNDSGVFVVSDEAGNESHPSVLVHGSIAFVAYEYYYENMTKIRLRNSNKYGQSWSPPTVFSDLENINTSSPAFDKDPGESTAYGVFISEANNSGFIYEVFVPDIKNIGEGDINAYDIDWSKYDFYNFTDADIVTYPNSNCPWVMGLIGSTNYENETTGEGPCEDSPMFCFIDPEPPHDYYIITWEPTFENCSNISLGRDHYSDNETVYAVCEQNNGSNQDLLLLSGSPVDWSDDSKPFVNQTFSGSENLRHPNLFVRGDDIFIAAETDSDGIVVFHSNDSGQNWSTNNIATGRSPVLFANETHIACTFTESGNLSIIFSANNLTNWTIPIQLNDQNGTVVEGYHNSDIPGMDHVVWTDNRSGNHDLYLFLNKIPEVDLEVVEGSIELVEGGIIFPTRNRIKFKINNAGVADVYNVDVSVTYECTGEDPVTITYTDCILQLNGGTNHTYIKSLFKMTLNGYIRSLIDFAGLQNLTVTVHHEDDTNPSNNAVTLLGPEEISYETLFPKLYRLENFFKSLKPKED